MKDKEKLQNEIIIKMQRMLNDEQIRELKNALCTSMYDYDIKAIKSTEITEYKGSRTQQLLEYFAVGKLSSNKTKDTISQYIRVVNQICSMMNKEIDEITKEDVRVFLIRYKSIHGTSDATMDCKRRYLSSVFSYLFKNEMIDKNPMLAIDCISYKKVVKQPLKDDEIEKLKLSCKSKRDSAIMTFFLDTGVRVSELCGIKLSDIDLVNRKCKVVGKGNKERIVYFSGKSYVQIIEYLKTRKDVDTNNLMYSALTQSDIPLFASKHAPYKRLKKEAVESMIKKLREPSGVERIHCHLFRATYATNLSKKGVGLDLIAKSLGHSNLNCLDRYVLNGEEELELEMKRVGSFT